MMRKHLIVILFLAFFGLIIIQSCQSEQEILFARYYTNGQQVYDQHCKNCHGDKGQGLARLYPALSDTSFLKINKRNLACIIKYGLSDTIIVNGITFKEKMPPESHLADIDIAAVITYITNSFGNKQGVYDVAKAGADLKSCRHSNEDKQ